MRQRQKDGFLFFLRDKRKKKYSRIFLDFMTLWIVKKEIPLYYFKFLYKKEIVNIKDYLSTREISKIQHTPNLHRTECMSIISNKLSFSLFCKKNNLPISTLTSHNFANNFFYNNIHFEVSNFRELVDFFKHIFDNEGIDKLFLKPFSLFGGKGACIVRKEYLNIDLKKKYNSIVENYYIHETVLVQHDKINKIHSGCINTIRFETFLDRDSKAHILSAFMRFGTGDSVVDNAASGGIYIGVNTVEGTLKNVAYEEIHFGGKDFYEHPNSNFRFKDFKIPFFKEACELVMKATTYLPDRYIGWDVAICKDGPILIEANEHPDIFLSDTAYGGYLKNPMYKKVMEEII